MTITAAQVKELREQTGLGMMECKQALVEAGGDKDKAIDILRKKAGAKVEKKAARTAAEGVISIYISEDRKTAAMVEVNSETDFVAKNEEFQQFAAEVARLVAESNPGDVTAVQSLALNGEGKTVAKALEGLIAKLGENMNLRRFVRVTTPGQLGEYVHGTRKIGVIVELEGGDKTLARDIAMHIAASRPEYVSQDQVPQPVIDKEKEVYAAQAKESGKPENIIEKMVAGRVNKFLNEITLLGQPFVKDPDLSIGKLVEKAGAAVKSFHRFEVGEGIEKKESDFASEVMAQVQGN